MLLNYILALGLGIMPSATRPIERIEMRVNIMTYRAGSDYQRTDWCIASRAVL
jgi:hypothetical protein